MNYTTIIDHFGNQLHRFVVPENIKRKLDEESVYVLSNIGLPQKIVYIKFSFYSEVFIDETDQSIVLGYHARYKDWEMKLSINDCSIYHYWKSEKDADAYCFYNSSVKKLLLCLYESDVFYFNIIAKQALGDYHKHHDEYSKALESIITKIDPDATTKGAWYSYIEEMSTGAV